jgi:hypothetical protein
MMSAFDKFNYAIYFGENGMIFADADIVAGMPFGASLSQDYVSCYY